jgi:hypothetical protein
MSTMPPSQSSVTITNPDFNLLLLRIRLIQSVIGEPSHEDWLIFSPCNVPGLLLPVLQRPFIASTRRNDHSSFPEHVPEVPAG